MSPQSEVHPAVPFTSPEYAQDERRFLLQLAHRSIEAALYGSPLDQNAPTPHLDQPRGAFTTLHLHGKLRGCIGYVIPTRSLYRTVVETAQAAAFDDPRFPSVTTEEAPHLQVEISVLSLPQPIRPEEVIVGLHGLIVSHGGHRGLLLPQVPLEWHWDRETYLSQTCLKAGLPADAWRQSIDLQSFTAEVFGDVTPDFTRR
jgi:AmmeMemoRadiSam system protein A